MSRPKTMAAGAVLLVSLLASACSGGGAGNRVATLGGGSGGTDSSTSSGTQESFQDAMLDFARCMRDHGVDMPDPTFNGDGGVGITVNGGPGGPKPGDATFEAAQTACQPILDKAKQDAPQPSPEEEAKMRDEALAFARCMRDHGVDMPDPTFDDSGHFKIETHGAAPNSDDSNSDSASSDTAGATDQGPVINNPMQDPKFKAAADACQQEGHGGPKFGTSSGAGK